MSDVLIIYKTKHHTTKQYAKWIQEEVKCDIVNVDSIHHVKLNDYKVIVFGSWIFDDNIVIAPFIKKHWDIFQKKHLVLFADGLTDPQDEKMQVILKKSFPKHIIEQLHFFPLGGDLDFSKISLWDKLVLKVKGKFRETHQKNQLLVKPIVVKIYELKFLN